MSAISGNQATKNVHHYAAAQEALTEIPLGSPVVPKRARQPQDLSVGDDEQPAPGDGCGWHFCFSGRCVQHSRTAKWLLFWMCWAAAVQGMVVNGFVNVNITTIEKRFNLMSGSTGIISGSYDVASVLVSVPVSYLGSRPGASKPRWLGAGLIILGLGSYMFMLPHLLVPPYEVRVDNDTLGTQTSSLCHEQLRSSDTCNSTSGEEGLPNFIWFFITGQYLMGFGAAPIYTLGMAFIDESVSPTQSAFYLGIFSTMAMVGPALGYAIGGQLLSVYIDAPVVNAAELGLTPASNRWLGAWWISFLITGSLSLLVAIPILMIPAEVDKTAAFKRSDRKSLPSNEDEGSSRDFDTSSVDAIPASGVTAFRQLDGLWTASKSLLSCLPFVFLSIAKSCEGFVLSGMATFLPKVLETQFSIPAGLAATVVGALAISGGGSGILTGGLLIKRLKMTCGNVIRLCFVVSSFCMFSAFIFFIRCPNAKFAGVNIPYNSLSSMSTPEMESSCNLDCGCTDVAFSPVCGANNVIYYSPCHAGCTHASTGDQKQIFSRCVCVAELPQPLNSPQLDGHPELEIDQAVMNACPSSCGLLGLFLFLCLILMFLSFLMAMPVVNSTMRCVKSDTRALGLGLQAIAFRVLGTIPGPMVFGVVIDQACELRRRTCGAAGACVAYDNLALGRYLFGLTFIVKIMTTSSLFLAWRTYGGRSESSARINDARTNNARTNDAITNNAGTNSARIKNVRTTDGNTNS